MRIGQTIGSGSFQYRLSSGNIGLMRQEDQNETTSGSTVAGLRKFDGARVLVVEDELVNQMVCKQVLEKMGIEVGVAENGQQAIETLDEQQFDLVLMDCQMPVLDGYKATEQIRVKEQKHNLPRIPIIALTAHAMQGDREACIEAGMDDYLSKPFKIPDLHNLLLRWLPEGF